MSLWTRDDAVRATDGRARGDWTAFSGISIDSRSVAPGDLFVALKDRRDGHDFVAAALAAGAAAALVDRVPEGAAADAPLLVVADTLAALEGLARAARARTGAKVVAVTGSVGKTSTKEMLRTMLSASGPTHAPEKSFNNHWGVPLTLARMPADSRFAVIEIGMNHAGEIRPLAQLAQPDVAVVTTVEAVHLENFDGVEQIADAKAEIFEGLDGGVAILNADNRFFDRLRAAARPNRVVCFGESAGADYRLTEVRVAGDVTVVQAETGGTLRAFKIGAPGRHMALNALAALAAVEALGADGALAGMALAEWHAPGGRGARETILLGAAGVDGQITLIDESYNANPVSMRAALAVLAAAPVPNGAGARRHGRRLAFLGDMLELGPEEAALHAGLADAPELEEVDQVFTAGPRMRHLHDALPAHKRGRWFESSEALADHARRMVDAGDVCMVKGSLGAAMARVVDSIRSLGNRFPGGDKE